MNPIEYLLLGTNVVALLGIARLSHKVKMLEHGMRVASRIIAGLGKQFLQTQGSNPSNMAEALYEWFTSDVSVDLPNKHTHK
jgi:hypothetical protein